MADRMDDNLPGAMNSAVDFLTRAHKDNSGLATAVGEYMGKDGSPGIPVVRQRAREAGLDGLLQSWRDKIVKEPARDEDVRILIPEEQIKVFGRATGLSDPAVVSGLAEVIPGIVYRNAQREHRTPKAM
ncbi:YidB family protein [Acetobacter conturbans]|uniref:DUF937 domain-containing protein n=1 Tax=Acetobacter conturbans TaxID=1737472 RepID=A0ABX0K6A6_9PROT|nr:YidB family protein [Acetobacter conturbans]NHN89705.1 hypothetical protein [Acetobacter conturbans]